MMAWFAHLSLRGIILLALTWPAVLMLVAIVGFLLLTRNNIYVVGIGIPHVSLLLLVLLGPSVTLLAVWFAVRKHPDSAT